MYLFGVSIASAQDILNNKNNLMKNGYYQTYDFRNIITQYIQDVQNLNVNMKNFTSKTNDEKIEGYDIEQIKAENLQQVNDLVANIQNQYKVKIDEANNAGNKSLIIDLAQQEKKEIEEVKNTKTKTTAEIKSELVNSCNGKYSELFRSVNNRDDIKYYLKEYKTNEIITNIYGVSNIEKYIDDNSQFSIHINKIKNLRGTEYYNYAGVIGDNYDSYFIIPKELSANSQINSNITFYNSIQNRLVKEFIIFILSFVLGVSISIKLIKYKDKQMKLVKKIMNLYCKIPIDVAGIIFLITLAFINSYLKGIDIFRLPLRYSQIYSISVVSLYAFFICINITRIYDIYKKDGKLSDEIGKSVLYKCYILITDSLSIKSILLKSMVLYMLTLLAPIAFILAFERYDSFMKYLMALFVVLYICIVPLYILRKIAHLNRIIMGSDVIVKGDLQYAIQISGNGKLKQLADNINSMKEGYESSLNSQVKSERFKAELITNVSHDLKTPLTSIITYVDLLKKPGITEEEKTNFINIIDKKSQRLKVLIEDLFEASKISSGAIELEITKVDVVELLKQTLGEFNEKIIESSLDFKFNYNNLKIIVDLDGKKTWRVFDNLISNILKYSQANTRAYIDIIEEASKVIIIMKNISAYEMEFSAEEIFERFKRGDKSRHTEGSGLGLAIAKSIVELEDGQLNIEIDGDLFKVIIEFKK